MIIIKENSSPVLWCMPTAELMPFCLGIWLWKDLQFPASKSVLRVLNMFAGGSIYSLTLMVPSLFLYWHNNLMA